MEKESKKAVIAIISIIIIVAVIVVIILIQNKTTGEVEDKPETEIENTETNGYVQDVDGIKVNTSSELNKAKEIDGLTVSNIQLSTRDGMTTFLADVTNNTGTATEIKSVKITLIDEEGAEIVSVGGIIDALENGETTELNVAMTSDYVEAYDFIITTEY